MEWYILRAYKLDSIQKVLKIYSIIQRRLNTHIFRLHGKETFPDIKSAIWERINPKKQKQKCKEKSHLN